MKKVAVILGAVIAAVAASACCILPLVLGVASAGALGLGAALSPYRPYLIGLTVLMLAVAFCFAYRPGKAACDTNGQCATGTPSGVNRYSRAVLWVVAALTLAVLAYPDIAAQRAREQLAAAPALAPSAVRTVTFAVGKMDCAACSGQISGALKKTPGVYDARVDFDAKRATVRYDPARVSVPKVRLVITSVGFPATEVTRR